MDIVKAAAKLSFKKYPLISNCIFYGSMCVGSEFSQQFINKRILQNQKELAEKFDVKTLRGYAVYGFLIDPVLLYYWYKWLDEKLPGTTAKTIAKKVLMDQFLLAPVSSVIFFTSMSFMERKSDIFAECKAKFLPTFLKNCLFYIPAQMINFWLVPPSLRIVYGSFVSFLWINILCSLKRKEL